MAVAPRGRAAARAAELRLPELDAAGAQELLVAADEKRWNALCDRLRAYSYTSAAARRERDAVLDAVAAGLTPAYRDRWNEQVGDFVARLGVMGGQPGTAESLLGKAHWPEGYDAVAVRLARSNLNDSATAGHILSPNFTKELCSVGYRNTYLSQVYRLAESHNDSMLQASVAQRPELQSALAQLQAPKLTWDVTMDTWENYRRALRDGGDPDLPAALVANLSRR